MNLDAYLSDRRATVDAALERLLPVEDGPAATVARAMRYAVLGGGKRLRPVLAMASFEACGGAADDALEAAAAMELIHTYSLVHDDLPAMDDDDLRRGRPTVHRVFGEAAAILAGDALLTLAFEILSMHPPGDALATRRAEALRLVAVASGAAGMVGGQIADLEAERAEPDADRITWIHLHKTAALLAASAEIGAVLTGAPAPTRVALARYGRALGLAFQIADDVLDETSTAEALGKTPGKDARAGKSTYPSLVGLDESRAEASRQVAIARQALAAVGLGGGVLEQLAFYAASRSA